MSDLIVVNGIREFGNLRAVGSIAIPELSSLWRRRGLTSVALTTLDKNRSTFSNSGRFDHDWFDLKLGGASLVADSLIFTLANHWLSFNGPQMTFESAQGIRQQRTTFCADSTEFSHQLDCSAFWFSRRSLLHSDVMPLKYADLKPDPVSKNTVLRPGVHAVL